MEVCALSGDQQQLHDFVDRFKDQVSPLHVPVVAPLVAASLPRGHVLAAPAGVC